MRQTSLQQALAGLVVAAAAITASAQGPASAPAPASGPAAGMRAGSGPMGMQGGMRGWRANRDNTPGWGMMSRTERAEHHRKVLAMTNVDECRAYMDKHRAEMAERAKQRGRTPPAMPAPRHDPCERLKSSK